MGKRLIIKGADFSNCAVEGTRIIDITSLFDFTAGKAFAGSSTTVKLTTSSTGVFGIAMVNIEQYAGKTMRILHPKYSNSSGNLTNWGSVFTSTEPVIGETAILSTRLTIGLSSGPSICEVEEREVAIPNNAKYFCCTWYQPTKVAEFELPDFYCNIYI